MLSRFSSQPVCCTIIMNQTNTNTHTHTHNLYGYLNVICTNEKKFSYPLFSWNLAFPVVQIQCAIRVFCRFCNKSLQKKVCISMLYRPTLFIWSTIWFGIKPHHWYPMGKDDVALPEYACLLCAVLFYSKLIRFLAICTFSLKSMLNVKIINVSVIVWSASRRKKCDISAVCPTAELLMQRGVIMKPN